MLSWRMMRFWYSASVAAHAMLKRMSQNDEATIVFYECFRCLELMHSCGFALREGVFAETKEGICRNKDLKRLAVKVQGERELKRRTVSRTSGCMVG